LKDSETKVVPLPHSITVSLDLLEEESDVAAPVRRDRDKSIVPLLCLTHCIKDLRLFFSPTPTE